jgi:hypothetical protein
VSHPHAFGVVAGVITRICVVAAVLSRNSPASAREDTRLYTCAWRYSRALFQYLGQLFRRRHIIPSLQQLALSPENENTEHGLFALQLRRNHATEIGHGENIAARVFLDLPGGVTLLQDCGLFV